MIYCVKQLHHKEVDTIGLFKTIRSRLFISYAGIIAAVVVAFATSFYVYTASILERRASESLQQLAINVNQYLDAEFENMSATANRIISSDPIKDIFFDQDTSEAALAQKRWDLYQLLFTVTGSSTSNQINLIGVDGSVAQFGKRFGLAPPDYCHSSNESWFQRTLQNEGRYTITPPRPSLLPPEERMVISVCRAFNNVFGSAYNALVEVQEDYDNLAVLIENAVTLPENQSNPHVLTYVYDTNGDIVYPLGQEETDYYNSVADLSADYGTLPQVQQDNRNILAYSRSDYSGWTVVVCQDEKVLLAPVTVFRNNIIGMGLIILLVTVGITYIIARQLTEPIRSIRESISGLSLTDLSAGGEYASGSSTYELTALSQAYSGMVERLEQSLEETVTARSREIESRMLALQAQMNPHFLYNTITIISIRAEQHGDDDVVEMCRCLTAMLRYITQKNPQLVPLRTELDYVNEYLYLMHCRFPGDFEVTMTIPDGLRELPVPKLLVQPLVENCFKHAFTVRAPWLLRLEGQIVGNRWRITITDNGAGFSETALAALAAVQEQESSGSIGLANIRHRLILQYREAAIFVVENLPKGGSRITIGGEL